MKLVLDMFKQAAIVNALTKFKVLQINTELINLIK